jgi:hypothetical protein
MTRSSHFDPLRKKHTKNLQRHRQIECGFIDEKNSTLILMKSILLTVRAVGRGAVGGGRTHVGAIESLSIRVLSCTRFSLSRRELIEAVGDRQGHRIRKRTQLTTRFQKSRHFLYVRRRFQKMLFRLRVLGDLAANTITAEVLPRNSKLLANVFSFFFSIAIARQ